jgi:hypothetical protein
MPMNTAGTSQRPHAAEQLDNLFVATDHGGGRAQSDEQDREGGDGQQLGVRLAANSRVKTTKASMLVTANVAAAVARTAQLSISADHCPVGRRR